MNRETYLKLDNLVTRMNFLLQEIHGLMWSDDVDSFVNAEPNEDGEHLILEWTDYEYVEIDEIQLENDSIDGVLFFGDGTIEFHYKEEKDAENWANFDMDIIRNVIENLEKIYESKTK